MKLSQLWFGIYFVLVAALLAQLPILTPIHTPSMELRYTAVALVIHTCSTAGYFLIKWTVDAVVRVIKH